MLIPAAPIASPPALTASTPLIASPLALGFTFFLTVKQPSGYNLPVATGLSELERGLFLGLLIGEGSFGGDGKQPQVTLRMHVRHESIFRWLIARFPTTRLYGPYHHGGRSYYQWMARGRALVSDVLPWLDVELIRSLDAHAGDRLEAMCTRYAGFIERERSRALDATETGDV